MKNTAFKQSFTSLYFVAAVAYIISSAGAPYLLSPLVKAFPVLLLMFYVHTRTSLRLKHLLLMALGFSGLGDIALAMEFTNNFIVGLAAFLVAHIFYILVFIPFCNKDNIGNKVLLSGLLVCYCLVMAGLVLPQALVLKIAVVFYMLVLCTMCGSAIFSAKKSAMLHAAGAFVFAMSDSLIAWDAFRNPVPHASVWIMSSYYLAQVCIVFGSLQLYKTNLSMADALHEN